MQKQKAAAVILGDGRRDFFKTREHIARQEQEALKKILEAQYEVFSPEPVFDVDEAAKTADEIRRLNISLVIIHLPIWGTPNLALRIANSTALPVLVLANRRPDTSSLAVMLAAAGMLEQSGKKAARLAGDLRDAAFQKEIFRFLKANSITSSLARSNFCLIGGRSIGIGTTVADPMQWEKKWHIEFDHVDQLDVVYRAEKIDNGCLKRYKNYLAANTEEIRYGGRFSEASLDKQIRSYLALKELAEENHYDFLALKCQRELSDNYALQCLSIALLNNTFDADGEKRIIPCACEGDCDGALTMRVLQLCDDTQPSCLVDIRHFDEKKREFTLSNCGGMAFGYAAPGNPPAALKKTRLEPHVFGGAGGAAVQFMCAEGIVTAARFFRKNGDYYLGAFTGEVMNYGREAMIANRHCPHAFLKTGMDFERFLQTFGSNHLHFIYGDYTQILEDFCSNHDVRFINYN